ncbi:hypothetical protein TGGT1_261970 [Toxoplasma gondii GT1]|uniref:Transmembrane protein n=3 Tax=Toxoplasma gondii TaxID=5811 RepID=S7WDU4_TOXGG|nr:hypothetical protein TGGT1_261970 [Toxoplasma gondii GT1]KAF4641077.1 hypothetical protein TGRH88_068860 [Toxoplasma gondii]RQX71429.1 putative transmembrane protein [Toxoplasma gondii CAST]
MTRTGQCVAVSFSSFLPVCALVVLQFALGSRLSPGRTVSESQKIASDEPDGVSDGQMRLRVSHFALAAAAFHHPAAVSVAAAKDPVLRVTQNCTFALRLTCHPSALAALLLLVSWGCPISAQLPRPFSRESLASALLVEQQPNSSTESSSPRREGVASRRLSFSTPPPSVSPPPQSPSPRSSPTPPPRSSPTPPPRSSPTPPPHGSPSRPSSPAVSPRASPPSELPGVPLASPPRKRQRKSSRGDAGASSEPGSPTGSTYSAVSMELDPGSPAGSVGSSPSSAQLEGSPGEAARTSGFPPRLSLQRFGAAGSPWKPAYGPSWTVQKPVPRARTLLKDPEPGGSPIDLLLRGPQMSGARGPASSQPTASPVQQWWTSPRGPRRALEFSSAALPQETEPTGHPGVPTPTAEEDPGLATSTSSAGAVGGASAGPSGMQAARGEQGTGGIFADDERPSTSTGGPTGRGRALGYAFVSSERPRWTRQETPGEPTQLRMLAQLRQERGQTQTPPWWEGVVPWHVWFFAWSNEPTQQHLDNCKPGRACWFCVYHEGGRYSTKWMTKEAVQFYFNVQALRRRDVNAAITKCLRRMKREMRAVKQGRRYPAFRPWREPRDRSQPLPLRKISARYVRWLLRKGQNFQEPRRIVDRLLSWESSDSSDDDFKPPHDPEWSRWRKNKKPE